MEPAKDVSCFPTIIRACGSLGVLALFLMGASGGPPADEAITNNVTFALGRAVKQPPRRIGNIICAVPNGGAQHKERSTAFERDGNIISSYRSLEEFTRLKASASASVKAFSADAKTSFVKSEKTTEFSLYLGLYQMWERYQLDLQSQQLTNEARRDMATLPTRGRDTPAGNAAREDFYDKWGDSFVQRTHHGGELLVVVRICSNDRKLYEAWMTQLGGSYLNVARGEGSYERTRKLLQSMQKIQAWVYMQGADVPPPLGIELNAKTHEASYDTAGLLKYVDDFGKMVTEGQEGSAALLRYEVSPVKEAGGWSIATPGIDVEDALTRLEELDALNEDIAEVIQRWTEVSKYPRRFEVSDDKRLEMVAHANQSITDLKALMLRIEKGTKEVTTYPLRVKLDDQYDFHKDVMRYQDLPIRLPLVLPRIVTTGYQIKRDPSSGSGRWPNRNRSYIVDPLNPSLNYFPQPGGSTGRLEYTQLTISFDPNPLYMPPGLGLEYNFEIETEQPSLGLSSQIPQLKREQTGWLAAGTPVGNKSEGRFWKVGFRLVGPMKDLYYLEYRCQMGNKAAYSEIAGNSPSAVLKEGTMVGGAWRIEGICLMIWPREWASPTK
jgi:hypothetical protein